MPAIGPLSTDWAFGSSWPSAVRDRWRRVDAQRSGVAQVNTDMDSQSVMTRVTRGGL